MQKLVLEDVLDKYLNAKNVQKPRKTCENPREFASLQDNSLNLADLDRAKYESDMAICRFWKVFSVIFAKIAYFLRNSMKKA